MATIIGAFGVTGDDTMMGFQGKTQCLPESKKHPFRSPYHIMPYKMREKVVTPTGFEPVAYRLGICRSILLSYGAPCDN